MKWPAREWICLECRSTLAGSGCPHGHGRTANLTVWRGRQALIAEVWGKQALRQRIDQAARAGTVGGAGLWLLDCDAPVEASWIALLAVVVFGVIWFTVRLIADAIARDRARQLAAGAMRALPPVQATGVIGTVITKQPAAARVVELFHRDSRMLYDAATVGFEVKLATGERVIVPAGTCMLNGANEGHRDVVALYLGELYPVRRTERDPFPFDRFRMCTLRSGDQVEILSPLDAQPDAEHLGGYRDAPGTILTPRGIPRLRKLDAV